MIFKASFSDSNPAFGLYQDLMDHFHKENADPISGFDIAYNAGNVLGLVGCRHNRCLHKLSMDHEPDDPKDPYFSMDNCKVKFYKEWDQGGGVWWCVEVYHLMGAAR